MVKYAINWIASGKEQKWEKMNDSVDAVSLIIEFPLIPLGGLHFH